MLVLSRKVGEAIHIGDDITVVVSRIDGNRVRLAFTAPRDVHIVRSELTPLDNGHATAPCPAGVTETKTCGGPRAPR